MIAVMWARIAAAGRVVAAIWMSLGLTVAVLAAIEIVPEVHVLWKRVLRVVDPEGGKTDWRAASELYQGQDWVRAYWREYNATAPVWSPYVLWRMRPQTGTHVNVDAEGRRRTWSGTAEAGKPEIWLFGGSTMFGMGSRDDHTIASTVAKTLDAGGGARVVNYGQPGWVMAQSAILLAEELKKGRRPDVVVFYDGANDVFSAVAQGTAGWPQNNDNRQREFNLVNHDRRGDLIREAVLSLLPRTTEWLGRLAGPRVPPPLAEEELARRTRAAAEYMGATATQVRALAAAHGFKTVFVLQPMIFDKPTKTPFEQRAAGDYAGMAKAYALGYDGIRHAAGLAGHDDVLDLSGLFAATADAMFIDFCHMGEPGDARIGAAIAQAVQARLVRTTAAR